MFGFINKKKLIKKITKELNRQGWVKEFEEISIRDHKTVSAKMIDVDRAIEIVKELLK